LRFASCFALPCSESIAAPVDDFKGGSISPKYKGEAEASPLSELAQNWCFSEAGKQDFICLSGV
jgi:hypothetical protein